MSFSSVVVYTDGANMPKHEFKHAGSAAIAIMKPQSSEPMQIFEWGRYLGDQTNNVAELCAIEQGIVLANSYAPGVPVEILSDSQYCVGIFTFLRETEKWAYKAKKNVELINRIRRIVPPIHLFQINWVRGHDGNRWNERADEVAKFCKESQKDWTAKYWETSAVPELV